ncbi:type VI secretion system contractile sheath large subunit, partial [Enterobacter hormaechei]|nr:type VI secretion system contractile sheath large subunit [Enterobacter hormaechei]
QLDAVMHHQEFQKVESLWRGLKQLVDSTDYRQNVKTEILDVSKEDLRQDFEDAPELIQSGLYWHTYTAEYDTPGGEPIGSVISSYEFDASPQDVALLRNISKVSAAAHMPFIGSVGPKFFLKDSMEEVAAIKDIGNYFDRAEYIKWKSFRDTDDARYIGLVMPRVLGRLPYGPDTVPVRSFNYVEHVKGPDHEKYLWTSASFSFASNMVKSFINNGWCVQIRGPQAGGAVKDLPIHLYDLGTGNQVKIPSEVMIPETREFEFANLGFIPLSYYKNRDYACFFSANSAQKPALYDTADATANSRINARLKDRKIFDKTVYQQLLNDGETILKTDLMATRDVVVKPGGDTNLDMPMEEETQFVAVVGLFRHPDLVNNTWKQVLKREDLDPDKPRILEAGNNHLTLQPLKDD